MKHPEHVWLMTVFFVLTSAGLCFGHACDDPWRPDPGNSGGPGSTGPEAPPAPPPPPPAPGDTGPGDPNAPGTLNDPGSSGLMNQLSNSQTEAGGGDVSPDSIVLIPETSQLKIVGNKGEFRTYIVNRSPRDLFAVKLEALSSAFDTEVTPQSIRRLVSGEKDFFTVKLKLKGELKSGKFPMDFKVSSRGSLIYEGSLGKTAEKAKNEEKQNLDIRLTAEPVKIGNTGAFDVFVRNNIYNEINQVKLECQSKYFDVLVAPKQMARLSPGKEAKFTVQLTCQKGLKPGQYDIRVHAMSSSRNVYTSKIITIMVQSEPQRKAQK